MKYKILLCFTYSEMSIPQFDGATDPSAITPTKKTTNSRYVPLNVAVISSPRRINEQAVEKLRANSALTIRPIERYK